jgi:hypothetical protein
MSDQNILIRALVLSLGILMVNADCYPGSCVWFYTGVSKACYGTGYNWECGVCWDNIIQFNGATYHSSIASWQPITGETYVSLYPNNDCSGLNYYLMKNNQCGSPGSMRIDNNVIIQMANTICKSHINSFIANQNRTQQITTNIFDDLNQPNSITIT